MHKIQHDFWDNEDNCVGLHHNMKNKPCVIKLLDSLIDKDTTLLEIGCGPGHYLKHYQGKVKRVVGLDYSEHMINIACKETEADLFRGSCWDMPFHDDFADVVFQVDVCLHIGGSWDSIKEMIRVAKKYVIFTGPSFEDIDEMDKVIPSRCHGMRWAVSKPLLTKELDKLNVKYSFLHRPSDRNIKHSILLIEKE